MEHNVLLTNLDTEVARDFLHDLYKRTSNEILNRREHGDNIVGVRPRNDFHRDYTRILCSSSFRRLQGKMQILGIQTDAFFRNRLTHSLEVSQIARFIASQIGLILKGDAYNSSTDLYVIEAAALAHDIGHPAFGHCGERVLDKLSDCNRFEGNAQNYRVLRTLEKKLPSCTGLNLTYRTLLGINKYIVNEEQDKGLEKFMYKDDYDVLADTRKEAGLEGIRTLDVQIIDIADEIAYAVHDLEDALSLGCFNIDEFEFILAKRLKGDPIIEVFQKCVSDAKTQASDVKSRKTIQEYSQIFRKALISSLTDMFIKDISIVETSEPMRKEHGTITTHELGFGSCEKLVHALKKITFDCINRSDTIVLYERRGKEVIEGLYEMFIDKEYNIKHNLLPPDYRPKTDEMLHRAVIDYIAGMMDTYAISLYEKHFGVSFDSITYKRKDNK